MSHKKPAKGQPRSGSVATSAAFFSDAIDVIDAFKSGRQTPRGPTDRGADTNVVEIKNVTGADRQRGEVIQLGESEIDEIAEYPDQPMFGGNTVDEELGVDRNIAILLTAVPDGEFAFAQVSGRCLAKVNVTDILHTHARPADGSHVLSSDVGGPIAITSALESTGEQEVWVNVGAARTAILCKATDDLTAGPIDSDFAVWKGTIASGEDSGVTTLPSIEIGVDIDSGKFFHASWTNGGWIGGPLQCNGA